jgi:hypothetical protein
MRMTTAESAIACAAALAVASASIDRDRFRPIGSPGVLHEMRISHFHSGVPNFHTCAVTVKAGCPCVYVHVGVTQLS